MLGIFETKFVGNLTNGFVGIEYFLLRNIDQFGLNILLRGFAGFFFYEITKIIGRKVQFISAGSNRWQPDCLRLFRLKIHIQYLLKLFDNALVDIVTGNELPVIKADTIVEQ